MKFAQILIAAGVAATIACVSPAPRALADEAAPARPAPDAAHSARAKLPPDKITQHSLAIGARKLAFKANVATIGSRIKKTRRSPRWSPPPIFSTARTQRNAR